MRAEEWFERSFQNFHKLKQLRVMEVLGELPKNEMIVLWEIKKFRDCKKKRPTVAEIAREMRVSVPSASRTIGKMEEKGLITRTVSEKDRRNTFVDATQKGYEECEKIWKKGEKLMDQIMGHFSEEELQFCMDIQTRMVEYMKEELTEMRKEKEHGSDF